MKPEHHDDDSRRTLTFQKQKLRSSLWNLSKSRVLRKFFPKNQRKVPFYRVNERFKEEGTSHPLIPAGISPEGLIGIKVLGISSICCNKTNVQSTIENIFMIEFFHTLSNKCFKYSFVSFTLSLDHTGKSCAYLETNSMILSKKSIGK